MAYTTQAKIEALFGVTLSASQLAALTDVVSAVTRYIDTYTGKSFEVSEKELRYFDGNGRSKLLIDSFLTASMQVEVLNQNGSIQRTLSKGQHNDYIVSPYNTTEKNELILTRQGSLGTFPCGDARVRVSAKFGASTSVPADISMVATKLAYQLLRTDTPQGTILTGVTLGDYQASYGAISKAAESLEANTVLDMYRDIEI